MFYLNPHLLPEIIRLGCDLMNLFYVYDEYTDIADGEGADKIRNIVMDAFRHPEKPRPEGELLLGEMAREFVPFLFFRPYVVSPIPHFQASGFARQVMCPPTITAFPISSTISTPTPPPLFAKQTIAPIADIARSLTTFLSAAIRLAASQASLSASLD